MILGLDLQPSAVAMVSIDFETSTIETFTKIYKEPVEHTAKGDKKLKNEKRRTCRGARRNNTRTKGRRKSVLELLIENDLLPEEINESVLNDIGDPFELRARAVSELLSPYELGRVLFQLSNRRGYLSNRKKEQKKEDGEVLQGIKTLEKEMAETNSLTLGHYQHLSGKKKSGKETGIYTSRKMYMDELDAILNKQQEVITPELAKQVKAEISFQKQLKSQKSKINNCPLEPKKKRAMKALISSQEYIIWQFLNNIKLQNPDTRFEYNLTLEQKQELVEKLESQKKMTWKSFKKFLKLPEDVIINMDTVACKEIEGNVTVIELKKHLNDYYEQLTEEQIHQLIEDLLTIPQDDFLIKRLTTHWKFDEETAANLANASLEQGHMTYSKKAIGNLLPSMKRGIHQATALARMYPNNIQRPDGLQINENGKFPKLPEIMNPSVMKTQYELKFMLEAFVKTHGVPEKIFIEMGTDFLKGEKSKARIAITQAKNRKENKRVEVILKKRFANPSRNDIIKYKLWEECNKICPYTGTPISEDMLFNENFVHVEHIIPESMSFDNSFNNKTLCMAEENVHVKKNKTPYQAYAHTPQYYQILKRVDGFDNKKKKELFETKDTATEFISRELNDTRYIARAAKEYLEAIGFKVFMTKGRATNIIRNIWNLNDILGTSHKNRDDHRHHAIDAAVVALTTPKLLKFINHAVINDKTPLRSLNIPLPWDSFKDTLQQAIDKMIVVHATQHGLNGPLHKETNYAYNKGKEIYTTRVEVKDLTKGKTEKIVDDEIKKLIQQAVNDSGKTYTERLKEPVFHKDGKTPIKKVTVTENLKPKTVLSIPADGYQKYYQYGSNHHVEIFKMKTKKKKDKWVGRFVTMFDAAQRIKNGMRLAIDKSWDDEHQYVMSLFKNDMLELTDKEGKRDTYRVQKMSSCSSGTIKLRHHASALTTEEVNATVINTTPNSLMARDCFKV